MFIPVSIAGFAGPVTPIAITYADSGSSGSNLSSYTFSAKSFGTEHEERYLLIGVSGQRQAASNSITSVTAGGQACTQVAAANSGNGTDHITAFFTAAMPTGTSGDVVVNFVGAQYRAAIVVWSVVGGEGTIYDSNSVTTGDPSNTTISSPENGGVVSMLIGNAPTDVAWTGVTEDFEANVDGAEVSAGHQNYAAAQSGLSVSADFGVSISPQAHLTISLGPKGSGTAQAQVALETDGGVGLTTDTGENLTVE